MVVEPVVEVRKAGGSADSSLLAEGVHRRVVVVVTEGRPCDGGSSVRVLVSPLLLVARGTNDFGGALLVSLPLFFSADDAPSPLLLLLVLFLPCLLLLRDDGLEVGREFLGWTSSGDCL